jgi:hypothetical protein
MTSMVTRAMSLLVAVGVLAGCASNDDSMDGQPQAPPLARLVLGASGQPGYTTVEYSCLHRPTEWCGPTELDADTMTWTARITVRVGATVRVRVTSDPGSPVTPTCWVNDAEDRPPPLVSDVPASNVAECTYVVREESSQ